MMRRSPNNPKKDFLRAYQPSRSTLDEPISDSTSGNNNVNNTKKSMIWLKRGRQSRDEALSVDGNDGSNEGTPSEGYFSTGSDDTEKIGNMGNKNAYWEMEGVAPAGPDYSPTSPVEKPNCSSSSPSGESCNSSQSESPTAVDQFPTIPEEGADSSDTTPKTGSSGRKTVSAYFNAGSAVIPLPFGHDEVRAPEVTRQTSKQYKPLLPHDMVKPHTTTTPNLGPANSPINPIKQQQQQQPEPQQHHPMSRHPPQPNSPAVCVPVENHSRPGLGRKRNSLEDVLKGDTPPVTINDRRPSLPAREPTICSIQEEEEFYERGRSLLRGAPIIPREAYVDHIERSLSPPTIDTRLQSTVDSRASNMHFSVMSRASTAPKKLPDDPNATIFIPIQPGIQVPLRRCPEVQSALENEFYDTPSCPCCERQLAVIADAAFLYCPICHEISPLLGNIGAVGDFPSEPEYLRFGLALGMTWETMKKVLAEISQQFIIDSNMR